MPDFPEGIVGDFKPPEGNTPDVNTDSLLNTDNITPTEDASDLGQATDATVEAQTAGGNAPGEGEQTGGGGGEGGGGGWRGGGGGGGGGPGLRLPDMS